MFDSYEFTEGAVTGQVDFGSHLDLAIAVTAQLVNELTPGQSRGRAYTPRDDQVSVALRILPPEDGVPPEVTPADAAALAELAGVLRDVFVYMDRGDIDGAAAQVNALLASSGARPVLARHDGQSWHLHYHPLEAGLAPIWAAICATCLATLLDSEYADRLGICSADACDRVFVDGSRNGTRRFCSTACQNRVKAAAFRQRRQARAS
jgi:predicted RNA-binding Zn ribbon-like protein